MEDARLTSEAARDGAGAEPHGIRVGAPRHLQSPSTTMDSSHRPLAFNKMEALVQEMQDIENGVPVRSQKLFLTSIPSAFMGYDLIEWLMEHLNIEESVEAVHLANQLCQYGYFFPVSDSKNLIVKDDSSLYRFQIPYYWPWQHRSPDNMEYAVYLAKRTLRNKQRHALEDYELEALTSLKKNLTSKWDAITMHAEEQVRLAKDRKKGDKIVADSQERAYWRVHRPPPGYTSLLEPVPICRGRGGTSSKKRRGSTELCREVQFLKSCLNRTRVKTSVALESLVQHCEIYLEYDPLLSGAQPCNPWYLQPSEEPAFWLYNSSLVDVPTEKRVKKWALSMEDLVSDETGLQEFTGYLKKEYNHENIKFWAAVKDLRTSAQSQIQRKVKQIYDEFLAAGAPCEVNIDGKTMEKTLDEMKNPTRFTFDSAAEHVYTLLLKKDCYPRFIRSDHYKAVLSNAIQPSTKKRFFGFGGPAKKKPSTSASATTTGLQTTTTTGHSSFGAAMAMGTRRRGSDRSLTGSTTELGTGGTVTKVSHSHSQSNLTEVPYSEHGSGGEEKQESDNVCPWDTAGTSRSSSVAGKRNDAALWDSSLLRKHSTQLDMDSGSSSSDISLLAAVVTTAELTDKFAKSCGFPEERIRRLSSTTARLPAVSRPSVSSSSAEDIIGTCTHQKSFDSTLCSSNESEAFLTNEPSQGVASSSSHCGWAKSQEGLKERDISKTNLPRKSTTLSPSCSSGGKAHVCKPPSINVSSVQDKEESFEKDGMDETDGTQGKERLTEEEADKCKTSENKSGKDKTLQKSDSDVCPWEDEESCKVDTPFVKTYATLGYL